MMRGEPAIADRPIAVVGSLLFVLVVSASAQDSTFLLTTADPAYHTPAFLGNGSFSLVASPLATTPARSFVAGVYDRAPGDVPRIAVIPAWNELNVSDGDGWLNDAAPDPDVLQSYRQTLDIYDGTLRTTYDWAHGAKRTSVEVTAFISRADPNLAVIRLRLVPQYAGRVTVTFPLREWPPPSRLALGRLDKWDPSWTQATVWYPGHLVVTARDSVSLASRADGGTTRVAVAQSVSSPGRPRNAQRTATQISFDAAPGEAVSLTKLVGVAASRDGSDPLPRARAAIRRAATLGYRALLAEHSAAWHRLWETDILVDGDPELQRVLRSSIYYLLSSIREGTDVSIPPMGLSSAGYYGHVFWDADTWMFPPLLVMHPAAARSMVTFRARTLDAARRNARAHGLRGAMYPWEADERGEETTPRFAWQNAESEVHVTGDVALAQWQYYRATGDSHWLARTGFPVIKETADFWVSRASFDSVLGRYNIRNVVSVDEGLIGIGNDAYTNTAARKNLEIALAASRRLGRTPDPRWARVAERLYIPYDSAAEYHPTYEGAPPETRGSVVPLLAYPLGLPMSEQAKRNDLEHAARRLAGGGGGGAMMTITLYPLVAAELGDRTLLDDLALKSYRPYLRPPFNVLAETPTNDAVNFVTGAGGLLQQVIFGYTGMRLTEAGLTPTFKPILPTRVTRLVLRNFVDRGRRLDIVVERDSLRLAPR